MFVEFNHLPENARIWIYQADRELTSDEKVQAEEVLEKFTNEWSAHGQPLKTSFQVLHNRFVILAVDEGYNDASGCSIDAAVRVVKEIGSVTGIDFFNRNKVIFFRDNRLQEIAVKDLKENFIIGTWNPQTITFNTLASTKGELQTWMAEAQKTWLSRYIQASVAPNA